MAATSNTKQDMNVSIHLVLSDSCWWMNQWHESTYRTAYGVCTFQALHYLLCTSALNNHTFSHAHSQGSGSAYNQVGFSIHTYRQRRDCDMEGYHFSIAPPLHLIAICPSGIADWCDYPLDFDWHTHKGCLSHTQVLLCRTANDVGPISDYWQQDCTWHHVQWELLYRYIQYLLKEIIHILSISLQLAKLLKWEEWLWNAPSGKSHTTTVTSS